MSPLVPSGMQGIPMLLIQGLDHALESGFNCKGFKTLSSCFGSLQKQAQAKRLEDLFQAREAWIPQTSCPRLPKSIMPMTGAHSNRAPGG